MLYNVYNNKKYSLLKYLLMFGIIFFSDSAFANYSITGYYVKIGLSLLLGVVGVFILSTKHRKISVYFLISLMIMVVSIIINSASKGISIAYLAMLVFAYYFTRMYSVEDFLHIYLNLMRVLVIVSLSCYFLTIIYPSVCNMFPVVSYSYNLNSSVRYYELIVTHIPLTSWGIQRNYGIFWEPGVFQLYINVALLISLFNNKGRLLLLDIIIFTLAVITTFSTTGYIAVLLVFACFLLNKRTSINRRFAVLGLGALVLCYLVIEFGAEIYDAVFYKFDLKEDNSSYISRINSILGNVNVAIRNPVFGVGYSKSDEALVEYIGRFTTKQLHQTNTILNYYATFGLFVGAYLTRLWWKVSLLIGKSRWLAILVFATLFMMLSGENMIASIFFNIIMFYGVSKKV